MPILLIFLFFILIAVDWQYPFIVVMEDNYCEKHNDCRSIVRSCCPHCSPKDVAVNEDSEQIIYYLKSKICYCFMHVSCRRPNYTYVPYCKNNLCILKKDKLIRGCLGLWRSLGQDYYKNKTLLRHYKTQVAACQHAFTFPDQARDYCENERGRYDCFQSILIGISYYCKEKYHDVNDSENCFQDYLLNNSDFCNTLKIQGQKDLCYQTIATKTKKISICEDIGNHTTRSLCKDKLLFDRASSTKNMTLCKYIEDSGKRRSCEDSFLLDRALLIKNLTLCFKLQSTEYRQECFDNLTIYYSNQINNGYGNINDIVEMCRGHPAPESAFYQCFAKIALNLTDVNKSEMLCSSIPWGFYRDACYSNLSKRILSTNVSQSIELCNKLDTPYHHYHYTYCYGNIAAFFANIDLNKSLGFCDSIKDKDGWGFCIQGVCRTIAKTDLEKAFELANSVNDIDRKNRIFMLIAQEIRDIDRQKAKEICNFLINDTSIKESCLLRI